MPTPFGHAMAAVAGGMIFARREQMTRRFWILSLICAELPDLDIVAFVLRIPYAHFFGHRGFFHSLFFAGVMSLVFTSIYFSDSKTVLREKGPFIVYFFLLGASHGILDTFTNGGLGIALFSPFDTTRYFFPWRPILVSPIGLRPFLTMQGWLVLLSEIQWILLPSAGLVILTRLPTKYLRKNVY
ncbi:MAG: metal-dependent hydrolase [Magnetococcales bacterium]|nr:metal-dependent hydrolase [Magnetococcales bacterium]